ncbi:MAG: homocysteine S-methyltransferase [Candidatus Nanopelagicales bacterium]
MKAERILDGGMSTQIESMGHDISGTLWTARALLESPTAIVDAHRAFAEAGADVLITASYQVSRQGFVEAGLTAQQADHALVRSVELARQADATAIVAASVGPYGAILHDGSEYRGNYGLSREQLADFHRERIALLSSAAPDYLSIETIPDVLEVQALADALEGSAIPAWITFSAKDDAHTCAGQSIEEAVGAAELIPGITRIGINCTDPAFVPGLIDRIAARTSLPIIVYPNAGGTWDAATGVWNGVTVDDIARNAVEWVEHGATWVGGCCGTDAAAIAAIRSAVA